MNSLQLRFFIPVAINFFPLLYGMITKIISLPFVNSLTTLTRLIVGVVLLPEATPGNGCMSLPRQSFSLHGEKREA